MDNEKVLNVLVVGSSGAGKSTLIKAISGTEVLTGVGEGHTQKIDVYESSTWPLRFIDTKGFEYNFFEQRKTIRQVKKFTKDLNRDFHFSSVTQSCPTLYDPMDCSTPGFPVYHQLLELTQTHVH